MEQSRQRTLQLTSLALTRTTSEQDIDAIIDGILSRTEISAEISEATEKLYTLQLISKAEQKTEDCKIKMDEICEWLFVQFMRSSNNQDITSKEALQNIKDEFPNPKTDIPTFFTNREQSGFFANFNADKDGGGFFEKIVDEEEFYNTVEGNIYEMIYEIVVQMIYIEKISDSYPMIYFPLTWTDKWNKNFLECFKYMELKRNDEEKKSDDEIKMEEKKDDETIGKRKRFLNQFRLKYKGVKTFKKLNNETVRCSGCRRKIDDGSTKNQYEIWRRMPFINDDYDKYEFVFHDRQCVLLRKYKEAIRQYIFEYELVHKRSENILKRDENGNVIIPDLTDDERLFYLYRDRNYILAVDSGKSKNELPQPSHEIERSFNSKTSVKHINIFTRRKRRLAAYHLHKKYKNEDNEDNEDKKERINKLDFTNHELLTFIDGQIYGIALWRFCVKQLEIKNRRGLWQIMNHLACQLSTLSILKELEDSKDSFKRFKVHSLNVLCQTVIQNAQFPAATALYLAAFMSLRGLEDESRKDQFNAVRELYVDIAKELLNKIESDHLLAIRLELPTDINYLTILDIGLKFELDDFMEFHRLQPIFTTMWREFEYLNPSQPFYTKDAGLYEAWILLARTPRKFYYTPLGLFAIHFAFYIMYLFVFTWFIYVGTYPYQSPAFVEYLLWIFNCGFIIFELQEMIFKKGQYFSDIVNYWDIFISLNWIVLFGMRLYAFYYPSRWIEYFDTTPPIIDEISTRSTDFFVTYTCLMGVQCVLLWTRLLSKFQRSNFLAPLIQMIIDMLGDVLKFGVILGIFMIAFIFALDYVIAGDLYHHHRLNQALEWQQQYPNDIYLGLELDEQLQADEEYVPPLDSPSSIFLYVVQTLLGQQEWELIASDQPHFGLVFFNEARARVVDAFIIVFSILGTILLLNLLIALMASTYERVRSLSFIRVNFFRSRNTYEIVNRVALMPPPLNILVLVIVVLWILTESLIEIFTCCNYTFSSERLNPLQYSLREKRKQIFMFNKNKYASITESQALLSTQYKEVSDVDDDVVDGRWIHYEDDIIDSIYNDEDENNELLRDDDAYLKQKSPSMYDDDENEKYIEAEKCWCFERLPKGSCRKAFSSKNSRRYCRFCRNDMRNATTGNIDEYFNLFRFHGQIIDEADINLMRELCSDKNYVHLCPHCFRPYILWKGNTKYDNDSNRHSRFQIMLEIISFYVFILVIYLPLLILMALPAIGTILYMKCRQVSKPRAFTGDDVLADIKLESKRSQKNTKDVYKIIKSTIDNKKKTGNSAYKLLNSPQIEMEKQKSDQSARDLKKS